METLRSFLGSKLGIAVTVAAAAAGTYLTTTHTGHLLAALPYLFLFAYATMHAHIVASQVMDRNPIDPRLCLQSRDDRRDDPWAERRESCSGLSDPTGQ